MLLRICSVYLGCGLRYSSVLSNLPTNTKVFFCTVYDHMEEADLGGGCRGLGGELGVTVHFSEIIELKFGKKLSYIICILSFFRIMVA